MLTTDVVSLGAARTPIGKYGGSLRRIHPAELGAVAARAALHRTGVGPEDVDDVWIGHARQAGSGPNPARQVGRRAGLPDAVPAQTVNKAGASGLQAIASGAQAIALGEARAVVVGGIESRSPRWCGLAGARVTSAVPSARARRVTPSWRRSVRRHEPTLLQRA